MRAAPILFALTLAATFAGCGPRPAPRATLPVGTYDCVWVGRGPDFTTALSFTVTAPGRYANTENSSRGSFAIHERRVAFHGGPFDGMTGEALQDGAFSIDRKHCAPAPAG